jgi:hypothetical protein
MHTNKIKMVLSDREEKIGKDIILERDMIFWAEY